MIIILLGAPGSGKGTQAELVSRMLKVPHISTGDMLRASIEKGEPLGLKAKGYMQKGALVPDEIIMGIIKERISRKDCAGGFILDGFPRTREQAKELDKLLKENKRMIDRVINIDVPENILIKRLSDRRSCKDCGEIYHLVNKPAKVADKCDACGGRLYQRSDDQPKTIAHRLAVYNDLTKPLLDYYKSSLKMISGDRPIDGVFEEIKEELNLNVKV